MSRITTRLSRDGWAWLVAAAALVVAALGSGNNLVYLIAAPVWGIGLVAWPLGRWQLRGVEAGRSLPEELVAGREAPGALWVRNGRARLAASAIVVEDLASGASGSVSRVLPGAVARARVRYRFPERGPVRLDRVAIRSQWPFGLFDHAVERSVPAEVVVFPRPLPGLADPRPAASAGEGAAAARTGGGDFLGLRPYRPGDPPRAVHWLSSARTGALQVVEREAERGDAVRIVVSDVRGPGWEHELSRAAGEVQRAFARGRWVSLALPGGPPELDGPPRGGPRWRRALLSALAAAPRRPPEPG